MINNRIIDAAIRSAVESLERLREEMQATRQQEGTFLLLEEPPVELHQWEDDGGAIYS